MSDDDAENFTKGLLIVLSLVFGFGISWLIWGNSSPFLFIVSSLILAVVYPIIGAGVVILIVGLREWAYLGDAPEDWSKDDKTACGAMWPVALIFYLIIFSFLGIIHRVY